MAGPFYHVLRLINRRRYIRFQSIPIRYKIFYKESNWGKIIVSDQIIKGRLWLMIRWVVLHCITMRSVLVFRFLIFFPLRKMHLCWFGISITRIVSKWWIVKKAPLCTFSFFLAYLTSALYKEPQFSIITSFIVKVLPLWIMCGIISSRISMLLMIVVIVLRVSWIRILVVGN